MKKAPVVILHGWGASSKSFEEVKTLLEQEGFSVDAVDLPGFGNEPLVKDPMTFEDYLAFIEKKIGKEKVILIGHSFGGRLAIKFTAENPKRVEKLILTGASGIPRPLPSFRKKAIFVITKLLGPFIFLLHKTVLYAYIRKLTYYAIGEMDYYKAGKLSDTFKRVYQISILPDLAKITTPTLIVWGENDMVTPLLDGQTMQSKIKDAKLIVVKGATHKLPYQMPHVFIEHILPFLKTV